MQRYNKFTKDEKRRTKNEERRTETKTFSHYPLSLFCIVPARTSPISLMNLAMSVCHNYVLFLQKHNTSCKKHVSGRK